MKVTNYQQTIDWYNANAKDYADKSQLTASLDEIEAFSRLLPSEGRVLDAGCGSGRDTQILKDKGFDAVGLDISSGLLEQAKLRHPECEFHQSSYLQTKFPDASFDGIWAHASLVHLPSEAEVTQALAEFNRLLKPSGILHVLVKAQTGDKKFDVIADTLSNHDRFFQFFDQASITKHLKTTGFEIIFLEQYREADRSPHGRPEVEWIHILAKKLHLNK